MAVSWRSRRSPRVPRFDTLVDGTPTVAEPTVKFCPPQRSAPRAPLPRVTPALSPKRTVPVVLAAGLGTRMRSRTPKVLHPICGRPMLAYVDRCGTRGHRRAPLVVISPQTSASPRCVRGTGRLRAPGRAARHRRRGARRAARRCPTDVGDVLVLNGDVPLIEPRTSTSWSRVAARDRRADRDPDRRRGRPERPRAASCVTCSDRVVAHRRGEGRHRRAARARPRSTPGIYAFDVRVAASPPAGRAAIPGERRALPAAADRAGTRRRAARGRADARGRRHAVGHQRPRRSWPDAELDMRLRINERHMRAGVTMLDPGSTRVDATVELAEDVTLEGGVILRGTHPDRPRQRDPACARTSSTPRSASAASSGRA